MKEAPAKSKTKIAELKATIEEANRVIQENEDIVQQKTTEFDARTTELKTRKTAVEERIGELSGREDAANQELVLAQAQLQDLQNADERERRMLNEIRNSLEDAERSIERKKT